MANSHTEVQSGSGALAVEGPFIGVLRPLERGDYRFVVRVFVGGAPDASAVGAQLVQVYELVDELHISASQRPAEPGADCASPFSIDRSGLRRFKPECL